MLSKVMMSLYLFMIFFFSLDFLSLIFHRIFVIKNKDFIEKNLSEFRSKWLLVLNLSKIFNKQNQLNAMTQIHFCATNAIARLAKAPRAVSLLSWRPNQAAPATAAEAASEIPSFTGSGLSPSTSFLAC
jgi:hypothetical protein